jgi:hypothetical protein
MTDKKISQLSAASTPLAGTEVLPIVQSSATVKVAADDLTVKNIRSNATSGILQVAGPAAAATHTMTVPDANFTVARTDAAQSFTGDQTLATGNLVIGTTGKAFETTGFIGINASTATTVASGISFLAVVRCRGSGGSAIILYENNTTPVIVAQAGPVTFVTGAPGANEIQIADGGSSITALAGATVGTNNLNISILKNQ